LYHAKAGEAASKSKVKRRQISFFLKFSLGKIAVGRVSIVHAGPGGMVDSRVAEARTNGS
jgi:hypothetical protein